MALAIANIPVLEGEEAERFVNMANDNLKRKGTVILPISDEEMQMMEEKTKRFMEKHSTVEKTK